MHKIMNKNHYVVLAGGVGAAKFIRGLIQVVKPELLKIVVNTGDDIELFGLNICPDLDIITYTLAELVDADKGWGFKNETFNCLHNLKKFYDIGWFNLGDKDLATHLLRTSLLREGAVLSEITARISKALGLEVRIIPMTDNKVETRIGTEVGVMHFQEYLIKRHGKGNVIQIQIAGSEKARPAPGVIDSILASDGIIICPSNPLVSIGPILSLKRIRESLRKSKAKKIAVTPLIGGKPLKGPLDRMMRGLQFQVSAYSIACLYKDFLDVFVLDNVDRYETGNIEKLGINVVSANTIMKRLEDKIHLARTVVKEIYK